MEANNRDILFRDECYRINGCIYAVYNKLGIGFLEGVYQEALEIELKKEAIPFVTQQSIEIFYDGFPLSKRYIADIICFGKILLEIKAVSEISNHHKAQLLNYLTATRYDLGLLINFHSYPRVEINRMIRKI